MIKRSLIVLLPVLACWSATAQIGNLVNFDKHLLHWGIQVGYTQSKFDLRYTEEAELRETMQGVTSYYAPGFHVAILGEMRLNDHFSLRTLAGVTLITRELSYSWESNYLETHRLAELRRNVESAYFEIPIELKFRAHRFYNFRPYLISGISYGYDLASLFRNRNRTNQAIVRLYPNDLRYSMGVGFDVFLRYVKFAIELKMNFGLIDLKVEDPDIYIRCADYFKSRTFMLSFTFE